MAQILCRTCRTTDSSVAFGTITPYNAQLLMEFNVKVPKTNLCSTICGECEEFLSQYDAFKRMSATSAEFFEKFETTTLVQFQKRKLSLTTPSALEEPPATIIKVYRDGDDEIAVQTFEESEFVEIIEDDGDKSMEASEQQVEYVVEDKMEEEYEIQEMPEHVELKVEQSCEVCGKTFSTPSSMRRHIDEHHPGARSYLCEQCNTPCKSPRELKDHVRQSHNVSGPFEFCEWCHEAVLKSHRSEHIQERHQHQCKFCMKKFPIAGSLRIHMNSHSDMKPYSCTICGQKFFNPKYLPLHMNLHTKKRTSKWHCNECNETFLRESSLTKHKRLQHEKAEDTGLVCQTCFKECRSKKHLESHILKHIYAPKTEAQASQIEVVVHEPDEDLPDFIVVKTPVLKRPVVRES